jgi:hypothetical protein
MFECAAKIRLFYCFQTKSLNNFKFSRLKSGTSAFFYLYSFLKIKQCSFL